MKKILDYKYFGEWNNILLLDNLLWYDPAVNKNLKRHFSEDKEVAVFVIQDKEYLYISKKYLRQVEKNINSFSKQKLLNNLNKFYPVFKKVKQKLLLKQNKSFNNLNDKLLNKEFREIIDLIHQATPFDQHCMVGERFYLKELEKYIKNQLSKIKETAKFNEYRTILTTPVSLTSTQLDEIALIDLAIKYKKAKKITSDVEKEINKYLYNFGWLPVFLFGPSWDKKYAISEFKKLAKNKNLENLKKEILEYPTKQKEGIKKVLNKFPQKSDWPQLMQEIAFIRNESETMVSLGTYLLKNVVKEITKRTGLSLYNMRYLTQEEVSDVIVNDVVFTSEIKDRQKASLFFSDIKNKEVYSGKEVQNLFKNNYERPAKSKGNRLRGICASIGKVNGKVKIIKSISDLKKFKKGDILVSESTCIDYVPIMRMASAIITELGGITSHAAIVSRELRVHCIVGVPNVHLVLKDNDKVEVDAEQGTIKKIT